MPSNPPFPQSLQSPNRAVFVDVFAWLKAIDKFGTLVMEGVFRHTDKLARFYQPAYYLLDTEQDFSPLALDLLTEQLGCPITKYRSVRQIADAGCKVWLSPAVDFPAPFLSQKNLPFKKVAILHDTLAAKGHFNPQKPEQFRFGADNNDAFAYVSVSALHDFNREMVRHVRGIDYIRYGCFHAFDELPDLTGMVRIQDRALSVHSLYPRKNLFRSRELTQTLGLSHLHVGRNFEMPEAEFVNLAVDQGLRFLGPLSDHHLMQLYEQVGHFICMSRQEGFSMPPMEAILLGVPHILLSDILIHREIYGEYSVTFFPPDKPVGETIPLLYTISEENRKDLFERFSFSQVIRPLEHYLATI